VKYGVVRHLRELADSRDWPGTAYRRPQVAWPKAA